VVEIRPLDPSGRTRAWRQGTRMSLGVVQAGFRERRKKLHNVLSRQLPLSGAEVEAALSGAGIDGNRRPRRSQWMNAGSADRPRPLSGGTPR